jgi:uncharacterized protein
MDPYCAPWWLPGRHLQTIVAPLFALRQRVDYDRRERWTAPDGDFIDVDWAGPESAPRLLVLFHGLEGSSSSHYARAIGAHALSLGGWRFALPHFRGCSGELNRTARAYHAADSAEIDWVLKRFADRHPAVYAAGVSLGANALLKWLCLPGDGAAHVVRRAAAVSSQLDMVAFGNTIGCGFNRVYGWFFLYWARMRRKALLKMALFPDDPATLRVSEGRVRTATTLPAFDDALTAPLHGFRDKLDYWTQGSTVKSLSNIRVPTLLLNARNDPFLPEEVLPQPGDVPALLTLDFPRHGGHAGFPGRKQWLAQRVLEFLASPES